MWGDLLCPGEHVTCLGYPGEIGNKTVPEQDLSASLPCQTLQVDIAHHTGCSAGKLSSDECRKILATKEDYQQYVQDCNKTGEKALPASAFLLPHDVAYRRKLTVDDQTDGVFYSDVLNASPGVVVAATEQLVQYRCSTLPQMSGGPCKCHSIVVRRCFVLKDPTQPAIECLVWCSEALQGTAAFRCDA